MTQNTPITLNLQTPNVAVVVYCVQNDRLARHIVASLYNGSAAWTPPAGAIPTIRFLKPDGNGGFYDTDEEGDPAITITGNTATLTIAEQATTVPGTVYMELNFYTAAGEKLTTFRWQLQVQQSVLDDASIISSSYYNVLTALAAQVAQDAADVAAAAAQITIPLPVASGGTGATSASAARTNLGITLPVPIANGGTNASTAATARANLGIPEPYNSTVLYNGNITTPVANATTLTFTDDATNYKYLVIQAYSGTPGAGTRMVIFDAMQVGSAHGIVGASGSGTMGAIYVERGTARAYTIVSSTFPSLYIQNIFGIK